MDELVTLEETDGGSDILLVVPKATVLQVRREQQGCSQARAREDSIAGGPSRFPALAVASAATSLGVTQSLAYRKVSVRHSQTHRIGKQTTHRPASLSIS